ncbi:metal-dependent hydrolase [Novosphingobium colocasiae]
MMPPVLAGLLWLLDRWQQWRVGSSLPHWPMRFGWLIALCYLGALTHSLLDLQNVYAVELFSPLSDRWFHTDGLFIISPWLLVICGLGVAIARRRWNTGAHCAGRPALAAIAATIVFVLINIGISRQAYAAVEADAPYARPDRIFASPEPIAFWRRDIVWRQQGAITHGRYDPLRHPTGLVEFSAAQPDYMNDPRVRRAAQSLDRRLQSFLAWSQMPMAQVVQNGGVVKVTFRDARFDAPSLRDRFTVSVSYPVKIRQ